MSVRKEIKWFLEKVTGLHVYRHVPRGIDLFDDIKKHLPNLQIKVIFDVGANTGQSAKAYLNQFPEVRLYSFEPVKSTFEKLQKALRGRSNVSIFQTALGATKGTAKMVLKGSSEMYFLLNAAHDVSIDEKSRLEAVNVETLDGFCQSHDISHIDYLKIDTEGGDFNVLIGASQMLVEHRIDLIELEAGMNPGNRRHVPFEKLKGFLEANKYFLFGIYEQIGEWPTSKPHLRRTNPVFISEKMISANSAKTAV